MDRPHTHKSHTNLSAIFSRLNGEGWRRALKAAGIATLAFLLSFVLAQPFSFSAGTLMSNPDTKDFNLTDFYNIIADSRPVRALDDKIVIVDIDNTSRDDVTDIIEMLSVMNPAAVGIDVTFNEPHADDSRLLHAIENCPDLVLAVGLCAMPGQKDTFMVDDYSFFYNTHHDIITHGAVNLPSKSDGSTIRDFPVIFQSQFGKTISPFAVALARKADADAVRLLESRGNKTETIDFPSRTFNGIPWPELPDRPAEVEGKVVVVGAMNEIGDMHRTPVSDKMSGVMIHAYAISTILNGNYYTVAASWLNLGLAFLLCFLLAMASLSLRVQIKGLVLRMVQVLVLYLIIRIGYSMFVDHRVIIDFSFSLLMLTFALFACDVWIGSSYIFQNLFTHFKNRGRSNAAHNRHTT
ncbi:MAG: CHASE2 domain-containing protein [Muribaculaceae bacterium]|nr:CHASE2 domain-containing protein [Muribaculaceae bacterium]